MPAPPVSSSRTLPVVLAAGADSRIAAAEAALAAEPAHGRALLLSSSRDAGVELMRRLARVDGARVGLQQGDLGQHALALARRRLLLSGRAPLPAIAAAALSARLVAARNAAGTLGRFAAVAERPGLPGALARTLADLRLAGAEVASVHARDPDLGALLQDYERSLAEEALADGADVLRAACEAIADGPALPCVVALDLPLEHRLEARFLSALCAAARRVCVTSPSGDERTLRLLREVVALEIEAPPAMQGGPVAVIARLQRNLFSTRAEQAAPDPALAFLSAPGEGRECVELARRLLWEAERGTPFERMAVLCQDARQYQPHVAEALRRAGIPAYFADGSTRPDPAGRALSSLLACKAEGLSATRFAEYLSLGVVPPRDTSGASAGDPEGDSPDPSAADADAAEGYVAQPRRWERALVDAAVIGGRGRWERRLHALAQALAARLERETAEAQREGLQRRMRALSDLTTYALPVVGWLDALPDAARWGQWLAELDTLARRTIARPARVLEALQGLAPMAALGPVGLDEVRRTLQPTLTELFLPPGADRAGRVFVGTPAQARGMAFDVVCVPGLAERIFPQKVREDPMLLDAVRARIDAGLSTSDDGVAAERLALRVAVGAARRRLIMSYPRIDTERARPRVPSFYGLELLRAAEGTLPSYDALIARAEATSATRVGWPAPADGHDAIDAAEHDLSLLQRLAREAPEATLGAARYLLGANPHLARALRFRARRWGLRKLTPADGLLEPGAGAAAALSHHALDARAYSPTALQHFATCPYRFLLHAVHGLSPEPDPAPLEEMDALQRGQLLHGVQFRLLSDLRERGRLPLGPEALEEAWARLDVHLHTAAEAMRETLAPAVDRVFDDGVAEVRDDLRAWLQRMTEEVGAGDPWVPTHFELSFGLPASADRPRDPGSRDAPVELPQGLRLSAAIDVVERAGRRLRAVDHKSGGTPPDEHTRLGGGRVLQPALYALALRAAFPDAEVVGGMLHYCTARAGFQTRFVPLDASVENAVALLVRAVDEALREGRFPALPVPDACAGCDYRVVCGPYEEQRTARKDARELRALHQLRRLP